MSVLTLEIQAIAATVMLVLINWLMMLVSMVVMLHCSLCLKARSKLCFGVKIDMAEIRRLLGKRNFAEWKAQPHQGRVAEKTGPSLLSHCKHVRRWAFLTQAPEMV